MQALAFGQVAPRPRHFVVDRILNLILYRSVASPAARHVRLLSAFSRDVFLLL
nr:MAG TPA: hypothetical protein [Caudoviricetes sp.]